VPVTVNAVEAETAPAVKVAVADEEPCGTVTVAGTLTAEVLLKETTAPPDPAAPVRVAVRMPCCPLWSVLGETEMLLNAADAAPVTVTVPPLPVTWMSVPSAAAPTVLVTEKGIDELLAEEVVVTVTTATVPLAIKLVLLPDTRHMIEPVPLPQ